MKNRNTVDFCTTFPMIGMIGSTNKKKNTYRHDAGRQDALKIESKNRYIRKRLHTKMIRDICEQGAEDDEAGFFRMRSDIGVGERSSCFCDEKNRPEKKVADRRIDAGLFVRIHGKRFNFAYCIRKVSDSQKERYCLFIFLFSDKEIAPKNQ